MQHPVTAVLLLVLTGLQLLPSAGAIDTPAATSPLSPAQAAAQVDALFADEWSRQDVIPAAPATDNEFVRRLYLDLAGRIPAVSEARQFLSDQRPDKRVQLVDHLLDSPASMRHLTIVWRNALIPQAVSQPQFRGLIPGFEAWLWKHMSENTSYDKLVREIITTPVNAGRNQPGVLNAASSPEAFFVVRELKPENLATGTARAFLGVRIDCAQCHDHPFDRWKRQQFWNLAAFYAGFERPPEESPDNGLMAVVERPNAHTIRIPGTDDTVPAVFLTGQQPVWPEDSGSSRQTLADWVTAPQNPWFAKMAVNRVWAGFFGQGLVQPTDDFSENNPPSHPRVLDFLADEFVAHHFDLQFLIRTMAATRVYQTSSLQTHASQADPAQFAKAPLRGLTPEQFFDSLAEAVGFYQPFRMDNPFVLDDNSPRSRYLELYRDDAESPLQRETTILQALAMMNGEFVETATSTERSQTLRAVIDFPLMSDAERLETLFLATLSRVPTDSEQQVFTEYLQECESRTDPDSGLADVFWVLLNSSEFLLNH